MKLNVLKEKAYIQFLEKEQELREDIKLINESIQLFNKVGKTHIILLDWYDGQSPALVTVGDEAYSKYGEYGIIQHIEFSENWYDCEITIQTDDGELITHTADRFY
jgi:hypothetical protein